MLLIFQLAKKASVSNLAFTQTASDLFDICRNLYMFTWTLANTMSRAKTHQLMHWLMLSIMYAGITGSVLGLQPQVTLPGLIKPWLVSQEHSNSNAHSPWSTTIWRISALPRRHSWCLCPCLPLRHSAAVWELYWTLADQSVSQTFEIQTVSTSCSVSELIRKALSI